MIDWDTLVREHHAMIFGIAWRILGHAEDAEDVVQEAYLRAFRFFDGFHGDKGRAWVLTIVRNTAMSWLEEGRASSATREYDEELHSGAHSDGPESLLERKDERSRVNVALKKLAVEFREVLVLREMEDLSYREIAQVAAIPIGTVMSRLSRARKEFAALLANGDCDGR